MDKLWSEKRVLVVAAALLVFTPLASGIFTIIGGVFDIVGFVLGLVNWFGLFVVAIIAAAYVARKRLTNSEES
jgi:hypothetical protein